MNKETQLLQAAKLGNLQLVKTLIKEGVDIEAKTNDFGRTALVLVVIHGYLSIAKFLVNNGACIEATDENGHTCLELADGRRNVKMVQLLSASN